MRHGEQKIEKKETSCMLLLFVFCSRSLLWSCLRNIQPTGGRIDQKKGGSEWQRLRVIVVCFKVGKFLLRESEWDTIGFSEFHLKIHLFIYLFLFNICRRRLANQVLCGIVSPGFSVDFMFLVVVSFIQGTNWPSSSFIYLKETSAKSTSLPVCQFIFPAKSFPRSRLHVGVVVYTKATNIYTIRNI